MIDKYTIIKDTREQYGWVFNEFDKCLGMELSGLKTGDYTIKGYEDLVCIERKRNVAEIANNVGRDWLRFQRELERMKDIKYRYIICEFTVDDVLKFPKNADVPRELANKIKINGGFILKKLLEIQLDYNIHILFCGNEYNSFITAAALFKRISERIDERV